MLFALALALPTAALADEFSTGAIDLDNGQSSISSNFFNSTGAFNATGSFTLIGPDEKVLLDISSLSGDCRTMAGNCTFNAMVTIEGADINGTFTDSITGGMLTRGANTPSNNGTAVQALIESLSIQLGQNAQLNGHPISLTPDSSLMLGDVNFCFNRAGNGGTTPCASGSGGTAVGVIFHGNAEWDIDTKTTAVIPEPGTLGMLGTGLLGLAGITRRKLKV